MAIDWPGVSEAPARPPIQVPLVATASSVAALGALVGLGLLAGHALLIPPMAASLALIAGAPALPLSQPRNVNGVLAVDGRVAFVVCAGLAAMVLVAFGLLRSAVKLGDHPAYWW